jgi:nucleotide-binding universal stress UspA family protein
MTTTTSLLLAGAAWLALAISLGIVMGRRGYSGFGWTIVGAALGPIAIVIALTRHVPVRAPVDDRPEGRPGPGPIDVLLAVDGSSPSIDAARAAIDLFARRLGTVTIATAVPFDASVTETRNGNQVVAAAAQALAGRLLLFGVTPRTVVLRGAPADALRAAAERDVDVIAVGSHGHGMATLVLGSVAAALSKASPVPVLIAGRRPVVDQASAARTSSGRTIPAS